MTELKTSVGVPTERQTRVKKEIYVKDPDKLKDAGEGLVFAGWLLTSFFAGQKLLWEFPIAPLETRTEMSDITAGFLGMWVFGVGVPLVLGFASPFKY